MNSPVIALLILTAGAGGFCALRNSTAALRTKASAAQEAHAAHALKLSQAANELAELKERIRELKEQRSGRGAGSGPAVPANSISARELQNPGPELTEKLLAELGFDWNSTGAYLIVSKATLRGIQLTGIENGRLREAACQVLAITPAERASIEARAQQIRDSFKDWAAAHVQRAEPEGDIVAKYTLGLDDAFGRSLSNSFVGEVMADLGPERGELFVRYAGTWMTELGMCGSQGEPTTMTLKRQGSGDQMRIGLEVKSGGRLSMVTEISPAQPLPGYFGPLFPGGWQDVAQREGFELPAEFKSR